LVPSICGQVAKKARNWTALRDTNDLITFKPYCCRLKVHEHQPTEPTVDTESQNATVEPKVVADVTESVEIEAIKALGKIHAENARVTRTPENSVANETFDFPKNIRAAAASHPTG
jgi:hypothetical protein